MTAPSARLGGSPFIQAVEVMPHLFLVGKKKPFFFYLQILQKGTS